MKTADTTISRKVNKRIVLEAIIATPGLSRAELSRITGLNKATISYIIKELEEQQIIYFTGEKIVTGSRQAHAINFNRDFGHQIIIEIKHKEIIGVVSDMLGNFLHQQSMELENKSYEHALEQVKKLISELLALDKQIIAIGISIPATIKNDKTINFAAYFEWKNLDLRTEIENAFGIKTYLENEANLGAIAEKNISFPDVNSLININVATGVGLGMMEGKELQRGYSGYFGEFGHMTLIPNGKQCSCGNKGCFELYTSDYHFLNECKELMQDPDLTMEALIEAIHQENVVAVAQYEGFIEHFAMGLHNLLVITNPEVIVLNSQILSAIDGSIPQIEAKLVSKEIHYKEIVCSKMPQTSSINGMIHHITQSYLEIEVLHI